MDRVRRMIQLSYARKMGLTGDDICVAVLDSGCSRHIDFGNRIICFKDFINADEKQTYDDNGHGTHVAGIIGGSGFGSNGLYQGVAPKCKFVILKVLDQMGNGRFGPFIQGLKWILENHEKYHIRILNISVAVTPDSNQQEAENLLDLVEAVWNAGIVVVAAAGNYGPEEGTVAIPGLNRKIITVGCLDGKGGCYLSGRGPTSECVVKPEFVAPGNRIISCNADEKGYSMKSGTSMATPIVTGEIALLLQKNPTLTTKQVKELLRFSAVPIKDSSHKQGWGMIQLKNLF